MQFLQETLEELPLPVLFVAEDVVLSSGWNWEHCPATFLNVFASFFIIPPVPKHRLFIVKRLQVTDGYGHGSVTKWKSISLLSIQTGTFREMY